jgi:hypothetical protein
MTAHQPRRCNWFGRNEIDVFKAMEVYSVPGHDSGSALFGSHVRRLVEHLQRYLIADPFRQGTRS